MPEDPPRPLTTVAGARLHPLTAHLLGFGLVASIHVGLLTLRLHGKTELKVWGLAVTLVLGQLLALGLCSGAVQALWLRWLKKVRLPYVVLLGFIVTLPVCALLLADDLSGPASRLSALPPSVALWLLAAVPALALTLGLAVARSAARGYWRLAPLLIGLAIVPTSLVILGDDYDGLQLLGTLFASLTVAQALFDWRLPAKLGAPLKGLRVVRYVALAVLVLFALGSVLLPPSNHLLVALARQPSAVLLRSIAELRMEAAPQPGADPTEWYRDRSELPPVPASTPRLTSESPIVLMIGIDSLRWDLLEGDKHRASLPNLFAMKERAVSFREARAPGSSTATTFSAIFSGKSYSQLYWVSHPERKLEVFPHHDDTPRFPELLRDAGVRTVSFEPTAWILERFAIVRGIQEENELRTGKGYPKSVTIMPKLSARLKQADDKPLFIFTHLLDAHSPYNAAGKKATPYEGYIASLGKVDGELGKLKKQVAQLGLTARTSYVVFSDHGEAFGEHDTTFHGKTLYEEVLRVPLFIEVPGVPAREVSEPVSLMDLGPTLLDLYGVATPSSFFGQSLVPFLRGEDPKLTRPIVAEARLMQAMLLPGPKKIIYDTRSKAVEFFDLSKDPGELQNIYGEGPESEEAHALLRSFFEAHTHRAPGYQVPYRKW